MDLFKMKRETKKSLLNLTICVNYLTTVVVSTATQAESQVVDVESTTAVESVDVVSVFSAPDVQEAKKIVADAKSINVIFFIIVCFFVCFFVCK